MPKQRHNPSHLRHAPLSPPLHKQPDRGIVEFSNVCQNDCGYCGIRKHQRDVVRYTMPENEVVEVRGCAAAGAGARSRKPAKQFEALRHEYRLHHTHSY